MSPGGQVNDGRRRGWGPALAEEPGVGGPRRASRQSGNFRHDPARRQPGRRTVIDGCRQGPGGGAARPARRAVHRGRLARVRTRKTTEFFERAAAGDLVLANSNLVAFGSTRKAGGRAETDPVMADLIAAVPAMSAWWPSPRPGMWLKRCARPPPKLSTWWRTRPRTCAITEKRYWSTPNISLTGTWKTRLFPGLPSGSGRVRCHARTVRH